MDPLDLPPPNPIDMKVSSYFSIAWRMAGIILAFAGLAIVFTSIFIGIPLVLVGVLIITTHYRLTVDFNRHTYRDYVWILGIKNGDKGHFEEIQYIYVTRSKVSQTLASRATQTSFVRDEFNGYLKFSEQVKIHLGSDASKKDLINTMQNIASKLKCKVVDYTINE
jgi:hypothetical protein